MADYLERPVSNAAVWAQRLAWFSAVLFATAGIGHRYHYLETPGFMVVQILVATLAFLALAFAALGFSRLWNRGDLGGSNIAAAVALSALVLAPFGLTAYRAATHPALHDISTDLDDPPGFSAALHPRLAGMNSLAPPTLEQRRLQFDSYPRITGRRYDLPFARIVDVVDDAVKAQGWTILRKAEVTTDDGETTLEATAYTLLLGLPSDVAIRLTDEDESTYVDMRSVSRYGNHDFGDNAARIAVFLDQLDTDVSALAGILPAEPADDDPAEIPVPEPRPSG